MYSESLTLGQTKSENNNRMITMKSTYKSLAIWILRNNYIKRQITLTSDYIKRLSISFHCTLNFVFGVSLDLRRQNFTSLK